MAEDDPERAFAELSEAIGGPLTHEELLEIGHLGVTMVVARTKHGLDAGGKTFKKYSDEYAKERADRGLRPYPPDLAVKGQMLGALLPDVSGHNEVTVSFSSEREAIKAASHDDPKRKGRKKREFLDIRIPREMDVMGDAISEILVRRRGR